MNAGSKKNLNDKLGRVSFFLGIVSLVLIPLAVAAGSRFESIGILYLLRISVMPAGFAAAICGLIVIKRADTKSGKTRLKGLLGLIFGLLGFGCVLLIMAGAFFFFLPMLFL